MVIKQKDDIQPALDALQAMLATRMISKAQRNLIEDEIENMRSGARGEKEAAYHIDFRLKDEKSYAVIHDLRLEHNGRVAQIDHLIIGREFDVFVIESKNFTTAIRTTPDGEFEVRNRYGWKGMASPVEQNKRHIRVLDDLIKAHKLTPARLGLQIRCSYHNLVLVPPSCTVSRSVERNTILKMDMFDKRMNDWVEKSAEFTLRGVIQLSKIVSQKTLMEFAQLLVSHHRPISINYEAKFGISSQPTGTKAKVYQQAAVAAGVCARCGAAVDAKVVAFCRFNSRKFGMKTLCRPCQVNPETLPHAAPLVAAEPPPPTGGVPATGASQSVFLFIGEDVTGPFDVSQLPAMISSGSIGIETPCCSADTQVWKKAGEFV